MGVERSMPLDLLSKTIENKVPEAKINETDHSKTGCFLEVVVPVAKITDTAEAMYDELYYLEAITGLDFTDGFQVLYHFNKFETRDRVVVRLMVGKGEKVPTISCIYSAALWHEREVHDFFGIEFEGSPDMRPLLMPEDVDFHPLLKDFGKVNAYHRMDEIYGDDK